MLTVMAVSVALRSAAFVWSLRLWWQVRDWRLASLPALLLLLTVRQSLSLALFSRQRQVSLEQGIVEIPSVMVSLLCLGVVYCLVNYWQRQQQTREALRESETLHRSVVESLAEGVMYIDANSLIRSANRSVGAIFAAPPERFLGVSLRDPSWKTIHENGDPFVYDNFPVVVTQRTGQPCVNITMGVRLPTHEIRWIQINTQPVHDARGETKGVVASFQDISARKRAESELRENEERFRQLAEYIDSAFYLLSWPHLNTIYASPALENIWGVSRQRVIENSAARYDHVPPEERGPLLEAIARQGASTTIDVTYRVVLPNGTTRWIRERAFPVRDSAGQPYRLAGIASDITDRRRYEETLRQRDAELAHIARVSSLGEMAAQLAHEVNQPLYAISNLAEAGSQLLASGTAAPEDLRTACGKIAELANRAGTIIRRILNFVRRHELEREAVDLGALALDTWQLVETQARRDNVHCEFDLPPKPLLAYCDKVLVQQVILNLLRNALEAMSDMPGPRRLLLRLGCPDARHAQLSVSDNGRGLAELEITKMFEPFFSTKPEGLGMGLAICRSTIEAHSGRLWAEPRRTGGATFHFTLPLPEAGNEAS